MSIEGSGFGGRAHFFFQAHPFREGVQGEGPGVKTCGYFYCMLRGMCVVRSIEKLGCTFDQRHLREHPALPLEHSNTPSPIVSLDRVEGRHDRAHPDSHILAAHTSSTYIPAETRTPGAGNPTGGSGTRAAFVSSWSSWWARSLRIGLASNPTRTVPLLMLGSRTETCVFGGGGGGEDEDETRRGGGEGTWMPRA